MTPTAPTPLPHPARPRARAGLAHARAAALACLWLPTSIAFAAAPPAKPAPPTAPEWRMVPTPANSPDPLPNLPPLTTIVSRDGSGETWRLEGTLAGSMEVAARDCADSLLRQGWQPGKTIRLGAAGENTTLQVWQKGRTDLLLMLFDRGPGRTGFTLGTQSHRKPGSKPDSHGNTASPKARRPNH